MTPRKHIALSNRPASRYSRLVLSYMRCHSYSGLIKSTGDKLIATYGGVKDLVIVQHDQVVMVCPKDQVQQVKQLVKHLADQGREDYL